MNSRCPNCDSSDLRNHCDDNGRCGVWRCGDCESYGHLKSGRWVKGKKE